MIFFSERISLKVLLANLFKLRRKLSVICTPADLLALTAVVLQLYGTSADRLNVGL